MKVEAGTIRMVPFVVLTRDAVLYERSCAAPNVIKREGGIGDQDLEEGGIRNIQQRKGEREREIYIHIQYLHDPYRIRMNNIARRANARA